MQSNDARLRLSPCSAAETASMLIASAGNAMKSLATPATGSIQNTESDSPDHKWSEKQQQPTNESVRQARCASIFPGAPRRIGRGAEHHAAEIQRFVRDEQQAVALGGFREQEALHRIFLPLAAHALQCGETARYGYCGRNPGRIPCPCRDKARRWCSGIGAPVDLGRNGQSGERTCILA